MQLPVIIVGWHIHPEAAKCGACGEPATVVVEFEGDYTYFNLCDTCLAKYEVRADKIDEVFRKEGF
jgi:hypothetical protein